MKHSGEDLPLKKKIFINTKKIKFRHGTLKHKCENNSTLYIFCPIMCKGSPSFKDFPSMLLRLSENLGWCLDSWHVTSQWSPPRSSCCSETRCSETPWSAQRSSLQRRQRQKRVWEQYWAAPDFEAVQWCLRGETLSVKVCSKSPAHVQYRGMFASFTPLHFLHI